MTAKLYRASREQPPGLPLLTALASRRMDITELMARGVAAIVLVYLLWGLIRLARGAWRWLRARSINDAALTAGRVAGKVERAASQAADAFNQGRRG